jgi:NAD(P)-dependent dehydrogenase (short-subunit alcohol dehydrogenase family)
VVALTENLAAANARYGVRANAILPGLMTRRWLSRPASPRA